MVDISKEEKSRHIARIASARTARSHFARQYNEFYDFASPHRSRVGVKSKTPRNPDEQNDIFDTTLQDTVDDFQSDMLDLFTPRYRDWTEFEAGDDLSAGEKRQVSGQLKELQSLVFGTIRNSNYYEAAQEMWADIGVGCGAIAIPNAPAGEEIECSIVQAADLLIEPGPHGVDGRWRELTVKASHLEILYPRVDWEPVLKKIGKQDRAQRDVEIIEGFHRDFERKGAEWWMWSVMAMGEVVHWEHVKGAGAPTIIPVRWRVASPSAWGFGPFPKAVPPARTLNELHFLMLKWLGKQVEPPFVYDQDTVFNPDQGIDAGMAYPRLPGTRIDFLVTTTDIRGALFEQEDLRSAIRRALFQDKPFQRGDTPPTATQWLDEKAFNNRRLELPRERINKELVLAVIQRFLWILRDQGRLPEIKIDGKVVQAVPQSPLSKASDAEDVNVASQLMQIARGFFPATSEALIDGTATLAAIQQKLNDDLVKLRNEDEAAQIIAASAQVGGASGGSPSAGGQPVV